MPHCMKVYTLLHVHMVVVCIAWYAIIYAIICWLICPCSLPLSTLLLLSSCCTLSHGSFFSWAVMKHYWKKLSSVARFGYRWRYVDGGLRPRFDWNPFMCCWLDVNQSWLKPLPLLLVGRQSNWAPPHSITFSFLEFHHHAWYFYKCDLRPKIHLYWIVCLANCLGVKYKLMVNCVHEWLMCVCARL